MFLNVSKINLKKLISLFLYIGGCVSKYFYVVAFKC